MRCGRQPPRRPRPRRRTRGTPARSPPRAPMAVPAAAGTTSRATTISSRTNCRTSRRSETGEPCGAFLGAHRNRATSGPLRRPRPASVARDRPAGGSRGTGGWRRAARGPPPSSARCRSTAACGPPSRRSPSTRPCRSSRASGRPPNATDGFPVAGVVTIAATGAASATPRAYRRRPPPAPRPARSRCSAGVEMGAAATASGAGPLAVAAAPLRVPTGCRHSIRRRHSHRRHRSSRWGNGVAVDPCSAVSGRAGGTRAGTVRAGTARAGTARGAGARAAGADPTGVALPMRRPWPASPDPWSLPWPPADADASWAATLDAAAPDPRARSNRLRRRPRTRQAVRGPAEPERATCAGVPSVSCRGFRKWESSDMDQVR